VTKHRAGQAEAPLQMKDAVRVECHHQLLLLQLRMMQPLERI
jgi:hypothetical protein